MVQIIYSSRWDKRTFVPDVRMMTSCELTSGSVIGISVYAPRASLYRIWLNIFIYYGDTGIWRSSKWPASTILDLTGSRAATYERQVVAPTPCKNFVIIIWLVFKLYGSEFWILVFQASKSYSIMPPKFTFWGFGETAHKVIYFQRVILIDYSPTYWWTWLSWFWKSVTKNSQFQLSASYITVDPFGRKRKYAECRLCQIRTMHSRRKSQKWRRSCVITHY